jgi:hypothetical protein
MNLSVPGPTQRRAGHRANRVVPARHRRRSRTTPSPCVGASGPGGELVRGAGVHRRVGDRGRSSPRGSLARALVAGLGTRRGTCPDVSAPTSAQAHGMTPTAQCAPPRAGHVSMIARLSDGTRAREGQPLDLWFDPQRLQLFDPETGRSLLAGQRHTRPLAPARTRIARSSDGVAATRHG